MQNPVRDPLAFPAGLAPGYDQTHIAATPLMRFSAVAMGSGALIPVFKAGQTTVAGSSSASATRFGPAVTFAAGNNANTYPAYAGTESPSAFTMAVIFTPVAGTTGYVIQNCSGVSQGTPITGIYLSSLTVNAIVDNGVQGPTFTLTGGVPYFLAMSSVNGSSLVKGVATNLLTGQILTGSAASGPIQTTTSASYCVGDSASGIGSAAMSVNAAMYSVAYMPPAALLAWAQDPWSFWYPKASDSVFSLLIGSLFSGLSLSARSRSILAARLSPTNLASSISARAASSTKARGAAVGAIPVASRSTSSANSRATQALTAATQARSASAAKTRSSQTLASVVSARSASAYEARGSTAGSASFSATGASRSVNTARSAPILAAALSTRSIAAAIARGAQALTASVSSLSRSSAESKAGQSLIASLSGIGSAKAPSRSGPSLIASIAAKAKAAVSARGAQGTGAFFSAVGALRSIASGRGAASMASALSAKSQALAEGKSAQSLATTVTARSASSVRASGAFSFLALLTGRSRAGLEARGATSTGLFFNAVSLTRTVATGRGAATFASKFAARTVAAFSGFTTLGGIAKFVYGLPPGRLLASKRTRDVASTERVRSVGPKTARVRDMTAPPGA
jgi:hypothetical protein